MPPILGRSVAAVSWPPVHARADISDHGSGDPCHGGPRPRARGNLGTAARAEAGDATGGPGVGEGGEDIDGAVVALEKKFGGAGGTTEVAERHRLQRRLLAPYRVSARLSYNYRKFSGSPGLVGRPDTLSDTGIHGRSSGELTQFDLFLNWKLTSRLTSCLHGRNIPGMPVV